MPTLKNTYSYVQENIAIVEINYGHQKVGYIGTNLIDSQICAGVYGKKTFYLIFQKLRKNFSWKNI